MLIVFMVGSTLSCGARYLADCFYGWKHFVMWSQVSCRLFLWLEALCHVELGILLIVFMVGSTLSCGARYLADCFYGWKHFVMWSQVSC